MTQVDVAVGQAVKATKAGTAPPAASIADLSSVWLVSEIDEIDARALRPDQLCRGAPDRAGRDGSTRARYWRFARRSRDEARGRSNSVENSDGALKLNMLAQFNPSNADDAGTPAVPEGAVLFENDGARVFVAHDEKSDS